jgi:hypothetical protein
MANESTTLREELKTLGQSSTRFGQSLKGVGDIWNDKNYAALTIQMGTLQKSLTKIFEGGNDACKSIDEFFSISEEDVKKGGTHV